MNTYTISIKDIDKNKPFVCPNCQTILDIRLEKANSNDKEKTVYVCENSDCASEITLLK